MITRTALAHDEGDPGWLSSKQAAQLLGITTRQLYRLIDQGDLPAYKVGRGLRHLHKEVQEYLRRPPDDPPAGSSH